MNRLKYKTAYHFERYELNCSPLAQKPTQKQLAELVGLKKSNLQNLATHKDKYIIRRSVEINGKLRNLAYPFGKLRAVHEKFKFHLNKIKQPEYLYSPRKGRAQRDNALFHTGQTQYLKIDIKQFYPSTTSEHIFRWAKYEMGMQDDVAGLFTQLVTVDGKSSFGSPLTPVLTTLVHRQIFDCIAEECRKRGLRISLWVDDINISGNFVPGLLVDKIRDVVRSHGLKTHKIRYSTGSRNVIITGLRVRGNVIDAPRTLHDKIISGYSSVLQSDDRTSAEIAIDNLLSALGRYRYVVGKASLAGRSAANKMNTLRQQKERIHNKDRSSTEIKSRIVLTNEIISE